jgi:hypothetical protein
MSVETAGIERTADLFSGPEELVRQNMGELAAVIIYVAHVLPGAFGNVAKALPAPAPHGFSPASAAPGEP